MASRRGVWLFSFVFLALAINGPIAYSQWQRHQIAQDGVVGTADVARTDSAPDDGDPTRFFVAFRFSKEVDPEQQEFTAEVDEETFNSADGSKLIRVRYLPDDPSANVVEGQVDRKLPYVMIAVADLCLLAFFALYWRFGRREGPLRLLATSDVERSRSAYAVTQVSGDEWVITGEIAKIIGDVVTMVSEGGREILVTLGEHETKVGYQQPATVRGRTLS